MEMPPILTNFVARRPLLIGAVVLTLLIIWLLDGCVPPPPGAGHAPTPPHPPGALNIRHASQGADLATARAPYHPSTPTYIFGNLEV